MGSAPRYAVIAACRNESLFAQRTLESLAVQTLTPTRLVLVDDGSSDETPGILADFASRHTWVTVVTRRDRGSRSVGPGVIDAFYAGLAEVDLEHFGFVCKLDLDLILPPRYFELLIQRMDANPRLGSFSGKPYYPAPSNTAEDFSGELIREAIADEMSVGASKFYRTACFKQIGGFVRQVMWDGIDCHRARMLGWQVGSTDDLDLRFIHLRPMGSSHGNIWMGRKRHGSGQWFMGTGLLFMLASAIYRFPKRPPVVGSAAMFWGYLESMLSRKPRYGDAAFRRFLRRYQIESLILGKRRAAARVESRSASRWNPDAPTNIQFSTASPRGDDGALTAPPAQLATR